MTVIYLDMKSETVAVSTPFGKLPINNAQVKSISRFSFKKC